MAKTIIIILALAQPIATLEDVKEELEPPEPPPSYAPDLSRLCLTCVYVSTGP